MKQISSTNFARQYPRLKEPHEVTALGRPIGVWIPTGTAVPAAELSLDARDDARYGGPAPGEPRQQQSKK